MTEIEQTAEELRQLREKQALHRRQLEENRQKALDKKKQTRRYVNLGKMVEGMIPGETEFLHDCCQKRIQIILYR